MTDSTIRFGLLVSMFEAMARDRSAAKKRKRLRTFLDRVYTAGRNHYFAAVRLVLPALDRERGTYGLKESGLATALVEALGISKDSDDARRLTNWRKGGPRAGPNAGNFSLVAAEVLQRRQGLASGGLTIKEVNEALDQLAAREGRSEKAAVLSDFIKKTNALEMKWILMIILKDLKLGISEKSIFHEFHPDAEDLFNVTCDLKLVCEKLNDRTQRHKRQDIEVGKPVRPQLAMRVSDAAAAWKKLHGKQVVVECKFDGDRIQIHKNGTDIHFFSRNFHDHSEYLYGMSEVILQNILVDRCILDGEMLVWDTSAGRFAEFGSNQEIAKAAKEGLESDCQLCYVVFDILYTGDTSVIHQSLTERHDLLRKVVKPIKGRLEILLPHGGLNDYRMPGEPCWSIIAYTQEDVERFFKMTIENRDEGIVLKDLGSKWEPSDRSGKWLKLKPDYIHAGSDLDGLIIGGYFGSGRRGGEVAQFLLGLAERSDPDTYPKRFFSFCRVGTGLSDEELDALITRLRPYFRKYENPKKVPCFYEVTNNSKERPDVWIESPDKSVILSITSDIRTIKSEVFAAPYSLRFPRIQRVRYDKPWHECIDLQSFVELVHSSNGNMHKGPDHGDLQDHSSKRVKSGKKSAHKTVSVVPTHFMQTDISGVKEESLIFANLMFYFINTPPSYPTDYFHKLVVENGGAFSMNLNDSVTHCIAAAEKGIKYQAAKRHGDIIHYAWVLDCCKQKRLVHLQPKYFLFLADSSKMKFKDEIDEFSDYYYWDLDVTDLKQIFDKMSGSNDLRTVKHYEKKYCPLESLCLFRGCCVYLYEAKLPAIWGVLSEIALRRMSLEINMRGGEVTKDLSHATHLLAYSPYETPKFEEVYNSFPPLEKHLLYYTKLRVVKHQWLEESIEKGQKLLEDDYNLKPDDLEEFKVEERQDLDSPVRTIKKEEQSGPSKLDTQKKSRTLQASTRRGRTAVKPARRTRARIGNRPAKLEADISENDHSGEYDNQEPAKSSEELLESSKKLPSPGPETKKRRGRPVRMSANRGRTAAKPAGRTQKRIGKRLAKIDINESESNDSSNVSCKQEVPKQSVEYHDHMHIDDHGNDYEGPELIKDTTNQEGSSTSMPTITTKCEGSSGYLSNEGSAVQAIEREKRLGEKMEMIDPLQAMLLDMIPSLSQNANKGKVETATTSALQFQDEKEQQDPDPEPMKKKKVSYKNVADELLKDW